MEAAAEPLEGPGGSLETVRKAACEAQKGFMMTPTEQKHIRNEVYRKAQWKRCRGRARRSHSGAFDTQAGPLEAAAKLLKG